MLDKENWAALSGNNPFPAIYQEYMPKQREWRITVVGDEVFQAAIYTDEEAKDDWRKYQLTSKVTFKKEMMPDTEVERCVEFLKRLGLVYGAFDFIESYDEQITFLECNTNGQFRWLEDSLGFPVTDAIVSKLIEKL